MADVQTYDPRQVVVIFGNTQLSGFAEDKLIEIKPMGDGIVSIVGADGEVGRSMDPDQRCEYTITLLESSPSNDYLTQCWQYDKDTAKGMQSFMVKDLTGTTLVMSPKAWIKKMPSKTYHKTIKDIEWTILAGSTAVNYGGNL